MAQHCIAPGLNHELLVKPFDIEIAANFSYSLVAEELKLERPVVAAFIDWLKERVMGTFLRPVIAGLPS